MSKPKYVWILKYENQCHVFGGLNAWGLRNKWPHPNTNVDDLEHLKRWGAWFNLPRAFPTKEDAEEWLFQKHVRKGRDVSKWKPRRYKNIWGFEEVEE